jgi:hypothetical protein
MALSRSFTPVSRSSPLLQQRYLRAVVTRTSSSQTAMVATKLATVEIDVVSDTVW